MDHEGGEHGYEKTHHRLHEQKGPKDLPQGVRPGKDGGTKGGIEHAEAAHPSGNSGLRSQSNNDGKTGTVGKSDATGGREHSNYSQPSGPAGATNMAKEHEGGVGFAQHHPSMGGQPHKFGHTPSREAHAFRGTTKAGSERHSGNANAHRIGRR